MPIKYAAWLIIGAVSCLPAASPAAEPVSARARLQGMSPEEKEQLAEKRERFENFSPQEQDRLRELNRRLEADPQADKLRGVMNRYYEWLKTLSSDQRAQLLSKKGEQRIELIHQFNEEQEKERFRRLADQKLSEEDLEQVYSWTATYIRSRESILIETLPEDQQAEVQEIEEEQRRWRHLFWLLRSREMPPAALPTDDEVNELIGKLSGIAKEIFAAATDDRDRTELVQRWIRASIFSRVTQSVTEEELIEFMQTELDSRLREHLEGLSRDDMQRQLKWHYFRHKFHGPGGGPHRFGPPGRSPRDRDSDRGPGDRDRNSDRGPGDRDRNSDRGPDDRRGDPRDSNDSRRRGPPSDGGT